MDTKKGAATAANPVSPDLEAQREYVKEIEAKGFDFNLVVADAFVRGMRDIGYKSSAWALCEPIDNAIQAEASGIHLVFDNNSKPTAVALIDDGHGMDPEMLRLSVIWGGSHRTQSRSGFGKYGYGLPSSSVSLGQRLEVYSIVAGGTWNRAFIDLEEIAQGGLTEGHRITVPPATEVEPPAWVQQHITKQFEGGLEHGTIVLLEKLDRIKPKRADGLQADLLEHFGVTYRNYLTRVPIFVNGTKVEPVDPLFLTPGYRFYDLPGDDERATELDPVAITVSDRATREVLGTIKARYSSMPPGFARVPEDKLKAKGGKNNARLPILEQNNGLIICREGRQIDVVRANRARRFVVNNDDRYWGIEIDFPAALDDEFAITTSKQQIRMSDRIWDLLEKHGVMNNVRELRQRYDKATDEAKGKLDSEEPRQSEDAMSRAKQLQTRQPEGDQERRRREAEEELKREAERRSKLSGVPVEQVERQLESEQDGREYIIETESMPGAPFYRAVQRGGSKVLYINTGHRFFGRLYAAAEDEQVRAALEVLLWVLAEAELDASHAGRLFYESERVEWSRRLNTALNELATADGSTAPLADPTAEATATA